MTANQVEETQIKDVNAGTCLSNAGILFSHIIIITRYAAGDALREESLTVFADEGINKRGRSAKSTKGSNERKKRTDGSNVFPRVQTVLPVRWGKAFVTLLMQDGFLMFMQEALCAQTCGEKLGVVMSLVIRVVNFMVARALNDRQFDDVGSSYPGLLLQSDVRWSSRRKALGRSAACPSDIGTFLEMEGVERPERANVGWLLQFRNLVDVAGHPNRLDVKTQGTANAVPSLQQAALAFESNLGLLIGDIRAGRLPHCGRPARRFDLQRRAGFTSRLPASFKSHFGSFQIRHPPTRGRGGRSRPDARPRGGSVEISRRKSPTRSKFDSASGAGE